MTPVTLDLIFERLWLPLKGISIEKHTWAKCPAIFLYSNFYTQNMGVN
jgi:hypothetical protein